MLLSSTLNRSHRYSSSFGDFTQIGGMGEVCDHASGSLACMGERRAIWFHASGEDGTCKGKASGEGKLSGHASGLR